MTVDTLTPVQSPARLGQATAVEQSRAVAEVAAAVQVAQACPRSIDRARAEMRRSCAEYEMACRAFYRYKRGGQEVTGPTVALARELKRCFGNFQSGMGELRRDDAAGQSEMQAWAWDVETNSRSATVFIVPHENYMTGKALDALRDVYENNANQGARREREMILGLLPTWYVEEAIRACRDTIERGPSGEPLTVRQDKAASALQTLGVGLDRVERRIGRQKSQWTPQDLAELTVDYHSIKRGELSAQDRFPAERLTAEDVAPQVPAQHQPAAGKPAPPAAPAPAEQASQPQHGGYVVDPDVVVHQPIDERQWRSINERFREIGVNGTGQAQARLVVIRAIVDRAIDKGSDLTADEARLVLDNLAGDPGIRLVARVLTEDEAPAHLIPAVPQKPDEAPADDREAADPGYLEDAAAQDGDQADDDPYADYDPTMDGAEAEAEGR